MSHLELYFQNTPNASRKESLEAFINENKNATILTSIKSENKSLIYDGLLEELSKATDLALKCLLLECIKIFSRDKLFVDQVLKPEHVHTVLRCAQLTSSHVPAIEEFEVIVEAQKCLCNLVFNSSLALSECSTSYCVHGVVDRLKIYKEPYLLQDIKLFDMKLLHLITGLNSKIRPKLRYDLHGLTYLIEVLDLMLQPADEPIKALESSHVNLCVEVLKVLFNISIVENSLNEEEEAHFMRLVSVLHDLLLCPVQVDDKKYELHCHIVHLLTVVPSDAYEELLTPAEIKVAHSIVCEDSEYEGKNMDAVIILLNFLKIQLDKASVSGASKELLCPILHSMCRMCRANRIIRKYCRMQILPYLGDEVKKLPEEGHQLRNRLCKLFTHNCFEIKSLSADFLFVLCKENTGRFIKYTGYGNAAGLLAEKGLMAGNSSSSLQSMYSSESEDSETEEYAKLKENVNPVTGRWEESKINAMDDMTEEQKEYMANELLNKIDQLQRSGVVKPMKVSESGRPVPVDSVAELVETCNIEKSSDDSD